MYSNDAFSIGNEKGLSRLLLEETEKSLHEEKIAVVVGLSNYPSHGGLTSLQYAHTDALAIGLQLEKLNYKTVVLTDNQATTSAIRNVLLDMGQYLDNDKGKFLFYFSGHGFAKEQINYLATYESSPDSIQQTGLSLEDVIDIMRSTGAKRQVLFIDACRNEPDLNRKSITTQRSFSDFQDTEGTQILFSTKFGGKSYEYSNLGHGVFTYYLLSALQGEARQSDGIISFHDLAQYVSQNVKQYSYKTKKIQVPFVAGEYNGDFLIHAETIKPPLKIRLPADDDYISELDEDFFTSDSPSLSSNLPKKKNKKWYKNPWLWIGAVAGGTAYYISQKDSRDRHPTKVK